MAVSEAECESESPVYALLLGILTTQRSQETQKKGPQNQAGLGILTQDKDGGETTCANDTNLNP